LRRYAEQGSEAVQLALNEHAAAVLADTSASLAQHAQECLSRGKQRKSSKFERDALILLEMSLVDNPLKDAFLEKLRQIYAPHVSSTKAIKQIYKRKSPREQN
jgi:hypothetical protein